jgi:protein-tyrosine phosphatase
MSWGGTEGCADSRVLELEGAFNLRDLGGYPTHDGRSLRWQRVYRSGVLSYLSERDCERAARLGVRVICDLRRADERRHEPTVWPGTDVERLQWDDPFDEIARKALRIGSLRTADETREVMRETYRMLPLWLGGRLRTLFERLGAGRLPILFHCAAGKDRTGIAAALLLSALDVPREFIFADYVLTNQVGNLDRMLTTRLDAQVAMGVVTEQSTVLPVDVQRALLAAHPQYLAAAFAGIEATHGSVDEFLANELGVGPRERQNLAELLLEEK